MSTLALLRTDVRIYIDEQDSTNSHFTDAQLNDFLNKAVTFLGVDMEWPLQTSQATAVQDQALYQLPSDFIELTDYYFNNTKLILLSREDLGQIKSQWQNDVSATPQYIYKADNAVMGLYPAPDSTQAGKIIQIQYVQIPASLVADSDVPDLHTAFQACLPFYAAYLCEHSLGNTKKSGANLDAYEFHKKKLMEKVQRFADDLKRFRWAIT